MEHTNQQNYHQLSSMSLPTNFNNADSRSQLGEQRDPGNIHLINSFSQSADSMTGFTTQGSHLMSFGSALNSNGSVWSNETSRSLGILGAPSVRRVTDIETKQSIDKLHHGDLNILQPADLASGGMNTAGIEFKGQIDDDWPTKIGTKDYTEKNLPRELMRKMFGLLKEGMFCDAVLQTGNKEIKIHKLVLLAASPFLLPKLQKPSTAQVLRLQIPENIPIEVTSQLVHYLYDGNVSLTIDNVGQFARVASLFKLEHLMHICEDFVECFSLDESLLNVSEEDIVVLQPIATPELKNPPSKVPTAPKVVKTESVKSGTKPKAKPKKVSDDTVTPKKGSNNKVRIEVSPLKSVKTKEKNTPPKVLHLYGTRAASAAAAAASSTSSDNGNPSVNNKGNNYSFTTPNIKPKSDAKSLNGEELQRNVEKDISNVPPSEKSIDFNPRKRRLTQALLQNEDEVKGSESVNNEMEDDYDENDDYETDYSITPEKNLVQNESLKSRRKPIKTVKKMKSVLYQSYKKVRQKKLQIAPPPSKPEITMRPPPKKRAKEFAKSEELSLGLSLDSSFLDTSESTTSDSSPVKKIHPKKKKKKRYSIDPFVIENVQQLVKELEKRSSHIPENERQFKCDLCGNEFVFPKRSITHVIKTHEIYPNDVFNHITVRKRESTPKVCDICGYATKDQNFYYIHYHKYFRHGIPLPKGWKPYTCEICGKECFTKFQLKDHKLIHIEDTPFVCEVCGQGFKSRTCLNSHVFHRHSSVRKHVCNECQKTFKTKTQLLVHNRTHTGEKPFHCPECSYKSTTRGNMRLHLSNRHKLDQQQVKNMMYQIKTLSKAFSIPPTDEDQAMFVSLNGENEEVPKTDENAGVQIIATDATRQQDADDAVALSETIQNIMATSQQSHQVIYREPVSEQSHQVVYREPTLAERHILLQSLGEQQAIDNALIQDEGQSQVVCAEPQPTPQEQGTQVLLPEHLQTQQIIVHQDQSNNDSSIIWEPRAALVNVSNNGIALIQDTRELQSHEGQQIQILNARSIIQEQHPEVTRTLQQEHEHIIASEGNRLNSTQGQNQIFTTERQILDQAQSLIQGRHVEFQQDTHQNLISNQKQVSTMSTPQQNQLHINRSQLIEIPIEVIGRHANFNIQPHLLSQVSDRHSNIQMQEHTHTVLEDTSTVHSQEQPESLVLKDQAGLFESVSQNTSKPSHGQTTVPLPRKQQLASLSLGGPVSHGYHTNASVSSKGIATQNFIMNTENIITSIESARPSHQSTPVPAQSPSDAASSQQTYNPTTTVASQSYSDPNLIYQYYQQYSQGS